MPRLPNFWKRSCMVWCQACQISEKGVAWFDAKLGKFLKKEFASMMPSLPNFWKGSCWFDAKLAKFLKRELLVWYQACQISEKGVACLMPSLPNFWKGSCWIPSLTKFSLKIDDSLCNRICSLDNQTELLFWRWLCGNILCCQWREKIMLCRLQSIGTGGDQRLMQRLPQHKWNNVEMHLNHSLTMTPFEASGKQAFWKHCGKRRNCS